MPVYQRWNEYLIKVFIFLFFISLDSLYFQLLFSSAIRFFFQN